MKKGVYACCLRTFLVTLLTANCFICRVQAYAPSTWEIQDTVSITALVQSAIAPQYPPYSEPTSTNQGVPLTTEAGTDTVIFKGMSYPGSIVSLLKNGLVVAEVPANSNGTFEIHVRGLNPGTYSFGIRAEDSERLVSKLELFTIYISTGITTLVDGIFISPTITTDKVWVKRGESLVVFGKSVPNTYITVTINSGTKLLKKTTSNASGAWLYKLDSNELEIGDYITKARSSTDSDISSQSNEVTFRIGEENKQRTGSLGIRARCDLNNDQRVDLKDFSIMAFWYKRFGFPDKVDLNTDTKLDLTDFSILAWCWTG